MGFTITAHIKINFSLAAPVCFRNGSETSEATFDRHRKFSPLSGIGSYATLSAICSSQTEAIILKQS